MNLTVGVLKLCFDWNIIKGFQLTNVLFIKFSFWRNTYIFPKVLVVRNFIQCHVFLFKFALKFNFTLAIIKVQHKDFMTEEYKVIGMRECTGKDVGTPTWVCVTPSGNEFTVRPEGTREIRREMFKNGSSYIGKMLTVKYQNLTDLGVPRFPVGIAFRDYE